MATLCCWTIVHSWRSERSQFIRIFELRTEILAYKRLLKLLVPPSLAPALLDRAYGDSRGAGEGGRRRGSVGVDAAAAAAENDRFAERFDEASVLFAEGEILGAFKF